jgi:hypothetical protein
MAITKTESSIKDCGSESSTMVQKSLAILIRNTQNDAIEPSWQNSLQASACLDLIFQS